MIMKNKNTITNKFETNNYFPSGTRLKNVVLVTFLFLCFFALLSGASAANFNSSSTNQEVQDFLSDTSAGDNEVVFEEGDYNQFTGLTVSRSVNISSIGQVNIVGTTGTLFTITSPNVKIVKLNISGYTTAINSNTGNLSVIGCNMSTASSSVSLSGNSLTDVLLENNTIISSVTGTSGAVNVGATAGSVVNITIKGNNITGNSSSQGVGVRFSVSSCNNTLISENNNITIGSGRGFYLTLTNSNNTITISNNNITGVGNSAVALSAATSNNTIIINNNNITSAVSYVVTLSAATSNNNITISNNNITSTSTGANSAGVNLDVATSNNTITINNNNITATSTGASSQSVRLAATNSDNTITISNNNITAASQGSYLNVETSNNTMTINNNTITGASGYGVALFAEANSNNNITINNNNITGKSSYGISLTATNSNNNITITNNNITGTSGASGYGVALSVTTSNNNITIADNNITGKTSYGVQLSAATSNNTIIVNNNNITGASGYGVLLIAYTSNNTISFIDNIIRGTNYGMYVNCNNNPSFSGLSVVNNTLNASNSNGIGIGFVNLNPSDLSDILVSGNNIFAGTTLGTGINFDTGLNSVNNVTINYNRVLSGTGLNIPSMASGIDASLNWWGINNITGKIVGINTSNHYILNITNSSSLNDVHVGDNVSFSLLVLNDTLNNTGVGNLPDFVINGNFSGVAYNSSRNSNFTYLCPVSSLGIQTVNASLDGQYVNITFYAIKNSTNSTIVISPNPAQIGENVTVSGVLANHTGIDFVNVTVDGTLFNVTVDGSGYWELNYTTNRSGTLDIVVSFSGNDNYTSFSNGSIFNVTKANVTININLPNNATYGGNSTINGNITSNGNLINGTYNIEVVIGDVVYNVTVIDGVWSLIIPNTSAGIANVDIFFSGNSNYNDAAIAANYTVAAKNLGTKITITSTRNGNKITYKITLKDSEGNILGNQTISLAIAGKNVNVRTNSQGIAQYTYTATKAGKYYANATYNGLNTENIIYGSSSAKSNSISITKTSIKIYLIKVSAKTVKYHGKRYRVYYKTYYLKNYGILTGSKLFQKSLKGFTLSKISKTSNIKTNYNKTKKILKTTVKNLAHAKIAKIKIKFYKRIA
ncbi:bacterial Ig-like domain protein [Methanobrevibacter cuticularis]|uniref:Bacterial Ig-like domain protein n=1 Tax=Methanobrevibacter cuticularis TaxID=47311 RepID=A0A166EK51_9EURY|nr:right-handed parallel beta-helix repeat-containing protein [Methanobrevibacter cuticularis]KZX16745.1 bacterial Ig-like domain protein [Methanobrevibacter cuticularis]